MSALLSDINRVLLGNKEDIDKYSCVELEDKLKPAQSWHAELIDRLFGDTKPQGYQMPWDNLHQFKLRPGELTIWAGINGHGKSLLLNHVVLHLIKQQAKCVIASLELHPVETLGRLAAQYNDVQQDMLGENGIHEFIDFVAERLWLYTETGDMEPDRVLAVCRYSRAELKADHIVIDSLMKCGTTDQDYAAEKRLVNSLQNIAKQSGVHIHLVAHSRKLKDETQLMGKFDVVGSGMITNMADNVMTISRNKTKELEARKQSPDKKIMDKPDTWLVCDKQRHGTGWEGAIGLWFKPSGRFVGREWRP